MCDSYLTKKIEWSNRVVDSNSLEEQVLRPVDKETFNLYIDDIVEKLKLKHPGNKSLLDVGCGNGLMLKELGKYSEKVAGIDYADEMIVKAKELLPDGKFSVSEAKIIPFLDNTFDRILCYSITHYFPNNKYIYQVIDEMIRVSKKGACIMIGDILDKKFEEEIKSNSDKNVEKKIPLIMRYSEWRFFDILEICRHYKKLNISCKVASQMKKFKTSKYRKDIIIEL